MKDKSKNKIDSDSPWKDMLMAYFQEFMEFFFPKAHAGIDWQKGFVFLDKEFQKIVRDAELGRRLADKLVSVTCLDGHEQWVLVHIEIQGYKDTGFEERMYVYNYRIFDRFRRTVVSLAVLADSSLLWRPQHYGYTLWDCSLDFHFPVVKLQDYQSGWEYLEKHPNLFAIVVMSHLKSGETRKDVPARYVWKLRLIRMLYERDYSRQSVLDIFRFIDWIMQLPKYLEAQLLQEMIPYDKEASMPYISTIEKMGMKRGLKKGLKKGLEKGLEKGKSKGKIETFHQNIQEILKARFNVVSQDMIQSIQEIDDIMILQELFEQALRSDSLEPIEQKLMLMIQDKVWVKP